MKNSFLILLFLLFAVPSFADVKISALTEDTTPTTDDLTVCVNDPAGTPASRKCAIGNVLREPNIPATLTRDSEWDTIAEIETATSVNIIVSTEIDTFSELDTLVADQTLVHSGSNVATATALAANGANCSSGSAPLGVDASGAAESCTDYEEDLSNSAGLAAAVSDETGSGVVVFGTSPALTTPTIGNGATAAGHVDFLEDSDNGTNYLRVIGQSSVAANKTITLPDATDTLVGKDTTDTLTNKTISASNNVVEADSLKDADHGDFTCATGSCTLNADVVAAAEMADADHGDISWSSGVASVDANSVALGTDTTGGYAASTTEGGGATSLEADAVDALTEIAQGIKSAADDTSKLIVGTAGSNGEISKWNTDGTLTDYNVILGTMTDGKWCSYASSGTLLTCTQDAPAGSGDVTAVGNCASGDCFTGASGTTLASNTDLIMGLDEDNNGTESFQILDGADALVAEVAESGLVSSLVGFDVIGAVDMDMGSADVTDFTVVTDGGTVVIDGNITQDAGTTLFMGGLLDATGAVDMDYGSADITDHTFVTDSTGTAEIVLPAGSIDSTEILNDTILNEDINSSAAIALSKTAITAGRSLTISTNDISVDEEAYLYLWRYAAFDPVATDDIAQVDYFKNAVTLTEFRCYSDQTVVVNLQRDDGSAANIFTADVTCDSAGGSACSSGCDTTLVGAEDNVAATNKLNLVTVSVSGTPTKVTMQLFGTWDD